MQGDMGISVVSFVLRSLHINLFSLLSIQLRIRENKGECVALCCSPVFNEWLKEVDEW